MRVTNKGDGPKGDDRKGMTPFRVPDRSDAKRRRLVRPPDERSEEKGGQGQRERLDEAAPESMRCPCIHDGDANRGISIDCQVS